MRIAVIHTTYSRPALGGATVDIDGLLPLLAREHEVHLLVPGFPRPMSRCRLETPPPVPYRVLPFAPWQWRPGPIARRFRAAVAALEPDLVLVGDGWHLKPFIMNALAGRRRWLRVYTHETLCLLGNGQLFRDGRVCSTYLLADPARCRRCVLTRRVRGYWYTHELLAARALGRAYPAAVERHFAAAELVIVYNEFIAGLVRPWARRVVVVPAGMDRDAFAPAPPPGAGDPLVVFAPGRLADPAKGLAWLARAVAALRGAGCAIELWTTGGGRLAGARDLGWLDRAALAAAYRRADVVAVPSLWPEPLGLVALEAMAAGRPVVAAAVGGLAGLVIPEETGLLVPPGDEQALGDALARLAGDRALVRRLGAAGRVRAEREFTWETVFDRYYRPLLGT